MRKVVRAITLLLILGITFSSFNAGAHPNRRASRHDCRADHRRMVMRHMHRPPMPPMWHHHHHRPARHRHWGR
ncbi:MAG TPA: hypothetical protein PLP34_00500 [Chitinophagaceae bacterium]|nr:hypothetical protein [Chitinophagaceae bacterium]HNF70859.1 hypothetical protein [Chitinophagaceae bacterium]